MMPILVALALDLLFQEPPVRVHPVVWMGRFLKWIAKRFPTAAGPGFVAGALGWLLGAGLCVGGALGVQILTRSLAGWGWIVEGVLLWPLFSLRMLLAETLAVETALARSLEQGRERLSRLVSRDTRTLAPEQVREATLETLSENLTDSVVAPLLWFAVLGLPGAALYRFANTADAMWGYRDHREWTGKWAARADDILNWIPARLAAVLVWAGSFDPRRLPGEAARTPSPNGGWTMGALALALGVRLTKPGVYELHPEGREPGPDDFRRGWRRVLAAGLLAAWIAMAIAWNLGP